MLISARDAASVMMREIVDTWPLFSRPGHCLRSGYALTGVLLAVVLIADFVANSFSSETLLATPVSAASCTFVNYAHLLVNSWVEFARA